MNDSALLYAIIFLASAVMGIIIGLKTWQSSPLFFVAWASAHAVFMCVYPTLDYLYGDAE